MKADGCVAVHADGGAYKPQMWMTAPNTLREEPGRWVIRNPTFPQAEADKFKTRTLAQLETRFRKMLDVETDIYDGTKRLATGRVTQDTANRLKPCAAAMATCGSRSPKECTRSTSRASC